jgi:hypothetical protein
MLIFDDMMPSVFLLQRLQRQHRFRRSQEQGVTLAAGDEAGLRIGLTLVWFEEQWKLAKALDARSGLGGERLRLRELRRSNKERHSY